MAPTRTLTSPLLPMHPDTPEQQNLIDALPGEIMHVREVTRRLAQMWQDSDSPATPPQDLRASQLNLVLHLGLNTTASEASERLDTAITFAQRNPCRIIVLCPMGFDRDDRLLEAKLFAQCYLGADLRQTCCCEALILGYPTREAGFLTNQIANWLEGELPIYHWFNRVPAERIRQNHMTFIGRCQRVLFDSSVEGKELDGFDWPQNCRTRDLAFSRILPVRQSLGQFLSSFNPKTIAKDISCATVQHSPEFKAEARQLSVWLQHRLLDCDNTRTALEIALKVSPANSSYALALDWSYTDGRFLSWRYSASENEPSYIETNLASHLVRTPLAARLLPPEKALSEAVFFS